MVRGLRQPSLGGIYGFVHREDVGSGWEAAVHPADLKRHADKWRASVATGEPLESEVRFGVQMANIAGSWCRAAAGCAGQNRQVVRYLDRH